MNCPLAQISVPEAKGSRVPEKPIFLNWYFLLMRPKYCAELRKRGFLTTKIWFSKTGLMARTLWLNICVAESLQFR